MPAASANSENTPTMARTRQQRQDIGLGIAAADQHQADRRADQREGDQQHQADAAAARRALAAVDRRPADLVLRSDPAWP